MVEPAALLGLDDAEHHALVFLQLLQEQLFRPGDHVSRVGGLQLDHGPQLRPVEAADLVLDPDQVFPPSVPHAGEDAEHRLPHGLDQRLLPVFDLPVLDLDPAVDHLEVVGRPAADLPLRHLPPLQALQRQQPGLLPAEHLVVVDEVEGLADRPVIRPGKHGAEKGLVPDQGADFLRFLPVLRHLQRQAGDHRPGVHVHQVVDPHELLDLPQGHPFVAVQHRHVPVHQDDDVPVPLLVEPGGLLRLDLVHDDPVVPGAEEVLQIVGGLAAVLPVEVALRGLQGGRDLDHVHVARLDLGLHQEVEGPVDHLADDAQIADFILNDDRLLRHDQVVLDLLVSRQLEKAAALVPDVSRFLVVEPEAAVGKVNLFHVDLQAGAPVPDPLQDLLVGCDAALPVGPGFHDLDADVLHGALPSRPSRLLMPGASGLPPRPPGPGIHPPARPAAE